jgi:hypothetical protein
MRVLFRVMPHTRPAPPEADALHRLVQLAAARAHLPVALLLLLLVPLLAFHLAAALFGRPRPARTPQRDWYPGSTPQALTDNTPEARAARRLRAWIGWILRGLPARGMRPFSVRPAAPAPTRTARAPPRPA